ncbi:MAG: Sec-independent protein translocase protein TatB [Burkholderiales bacterium]
MFDIGFTELMVIGVVALVVVGPERLPKVARTVGILMGRMQRYVAGVKADISREMNEFESLKDLKDLRKEVEATGSEIESDMRKNMLEAQSQVNTISNEVGTGFAKAANGLNALGEASIANAASQHPANQIDVSVPKPVAPRAEPSPQLELALDSSAAAQETQPAAATKV